MNTIPGFHHIRWQTKLERVFNENELSSLVKHKHLLPSKPNAAKFPFVKAQNFRNNIANYLKQDIKIKVKQKSALNLEVLNSKLFADVPKQQKKRRPQTTNELK